jgi:hypothetical protein
MNKVPPTPEWVTYVGDVFFLVLFLIVAFFFKPSKEETEEVNPEEQPNELEQMLVTENGNSEATAEAVTEQEIEKKEAAQVKE